MRCIGLAHALSCNRDLRNFQPDGTAGSTTIALINRNEIFLRLTAEWNRTGSICASRILGSDCFNEAVSQKTVVVNFSDQGHLALVECVIAVKLSAVQIHLMLRE